MEFSNSSIELALLPKAEEVSFQPIEPSYWKVLQIEWLITSILILVIGGVAIFFIKALHQPAIIGMAAGLWLLIIITSYWLSNKSFLRKAYAMREKDVMYRTGFIIRELHVCPFNRIQHCSVHAGPLERQYGLASISLFTSGSDGSDLKIPGLTEEKAAAIREFIMHKVRNDEQPAN
ncbi:MAG: PH domain-containing protein [Chitinophagaceae bacterium]